MDSIFIQVLFPFIFSFLIVIIITIIAEKFGTKVGGIFGTLPSTIVVAYIFISLNKGLVFASKSVAIIPAELGVNIIFLLFFAIFVYRSTIVAFTISFASWTFLSLILYMSQITDIVISIEIYVVILVLSFLFLEYHKKIPSSEKVDIHYTTKKIIFRGILAGIIISISVILSNIGEVISGIFSVFPAILSSTMLIFVREHGPKFTAGMAKSMIIGISSVCTYAIAIHFLYPKYGLILGTLIAYLISLGVTLILFVFREKIR